MNQLDMTVTNTVTVTSITDPELLCFSLRCRRAGTPAIYRVEIGRFADRWLWRESQGRTYLMCAADAASTIGFLREQGITIRGTL